MVLVTSSKYFLKQLLLCAFVSGLTSNYSVGILCYYCYYCSSLMMILSAREHLKAEPAQRSLVPCEEVVPSLPALMRRLLGVIWVDKEWVSLTTTLLLLLFLYTLTFSNYYYPVTGPGKLGSHRSSLLAHLVNYLEDC